MKKHVALIFCLLLAGCTDADWDRTLNYVYPASDDAAVTSEGDGQPATASAHAAPPAISSTAASAEQPANADFCRAVATQDATANGFDQETQQRVFARSYGQCVAIYNR
jgi:hypothetical protein